MTDRMRRGGDSVPVGVIVIGRNEGEHLERALRSCTTYGGTKVVYVDSGSTDGSVESARAIGVVVHELDAGRPFSAARARREGVEVLVQRHPDLEYIQFLDGDCELDGGWLDRALAHLDNHDDLAIVCGMLAEKDPQASVYNKMSALQWNAATGDIEACGGIFMVRLSDYQAAGGFNDALLTGEEEELCRRIRRAGRRIVRIASPMAVHDSGLLRFSQWWGRAVWGGYGEGIKFSTVPARGLTGWLRQLQKRLLWPVAVPGIAVLGGVAMLWSLWFSLLPFGCLAAYGALFARIAFHRLRLGDSAGDAMLYSSLMILRKFPVAMGFLLYFIQRGERSHRPDPHAAASSVSASGREATAAGLK